MSSPFSTPDFSGKGSNLHIQSIHSLFTLNALPAELPPACVPGPGVPLGSDRGGHQAGAALGHCGGQAT